MDEHLQNQIIQELHTCYKNLRYPDFSFLQETLVQAPYTIIREKLAHLGAIDVTDLDFSVCESFQILLTDSPIHIHTSLIGKYSYILHEDNVVEEEKTDDSLVLSIISLLKEQGFILFTQQQLLHILPIPPEEKVRIDFVACAKKKVEPFSVKGLVFTPTLDQGRFIEGQIHKKQRESGLL